MRIEIRDLVVVVLGGVLGMSGSALALRGGGNDTARFDQFSTRLATLEATPPDPSLPKAVKTLQAQLSAVLDGDDRLRCRSIVLLDAKGKKRGHLGFTDDGSTAMLSLYASDGKLRACLLGFNEGASFSLMDERCRQVVSLLGGLIGSSLTLQDISGTTYVGTPMLGISIATSQGKHLWQSPSLDKP